LLTPGPRPVWARVWLRHCPWPPFQDLHHQGVCFATKVAAWSLLGAQYISGAGLSVSELDLSTCSFGTLDNIENIPIVE